MKTEKDSHPKEMSEAEMRKLLVDKVPDALIVTDRNGIVQYWNPGAENAFGYKKAEAIGKTLDDLIIVPHLKGDQNAVKNQVGTDVTVTYEAYRRKKCGSLICINSKTRVDRDEAGEVRYYISSKWDVTHLKVKRDIELMETEYKGRLGNMPDAIFIMNITGHIVLVNHQTEKLFGYEQGELKGKKVEILLPERFRAAHVMHRAAYYVEPHIREMGRGRELFGLRKDGTEFSVEIGLSPQKVKDGTMIIGAVRDVTERKRAEQKFRSLLEATPDAIVIINSEGSIVLVNSQTERVFVYPRDEILGKKVEVLMPKRYQGKHPALREKFSADPKSRPMGGGRELFGRRKDETEFPVEISLNAIETEEGKLSLATIRDVSERKLLEDELLERERKLQVLIREMEAFSYSIAHDLRAPLRHIDGFVGILLHGNHDLPEKVREYLVRISTFAKQMNQLMDDLLQLAKLTYDELHLGKVNLSSIAQKIVTLLRQESPDRKIVCDITPGMIVIADPNKLRIVYDNLLRNAWKFTRKQEAARIEVGVIERDGSQVYFVRDNGAGFDMRYAGRLFNPFQRLHSLDEFEGTGIGLAIVHRIIARHGGNITASAKVGEGATFEFTIPKAQSSEELAA